MGIGSFKLPTTVGSGGGPCPAGVTEWSQEYYDWVVTNYEYQRPTDWLTMPTLTQGDQVVNLLIPVYENDSNFVAFLLTTSTGQYNVDWGDGTNSNHNTNTVAQHQYTFTDLNVSTLTTKGFRQAMVTITPVTGNLLTIDFAQIHTQASLLQGFATRIIEVSMAGPFFTTIKCYTSGKPYLKLMEKFTFIGTNSIINASQMFYYCQALENVSIDTSSVTNMTQMFFNCSNMKYGPVLNTGSVSNFSYMFQNSNSLITTALYDGLSVTNSSNMFNGCFSLLFGTPYVFDGSLTDCSYMFKNCYSLKQSPDYYTTNVTNFTEMFTFCYSLRNIPTLDTAKGTQFPSMFNYCNSLITVPDMNLSKGLNICRMFYYCTSIREVGTLSLHTTSTITDSSYLFAYSQSITYIKPFSTSAKLLNYQYMFQDCRSLVEVPVASVTTATTINQPFSNCQSLARIPWTDIGVTISLASLSLGPVALVEVFNNLKVSSAKTITITGNWGAALLSAGDRAIATGKGWTIVG